MGSVQFQIAPCSNLYTSQYLKAPSGVVSVIYRDLSVAPVPSEAVPFVYLASVCWSSVSNFRPDTGGWRWSLVQVRWFSHAVGREGHSRQMSLARVGSTHSVPATLGLPRSWVCAFPVYTAQAPRCCIWSGPCIACGSSFRVLHKSTDLVGPEFCAFPVRAAQAARSLTGALSLSAVRLPPSAVPASVHARQSGACGLFSGAGL